MFHWFRHNAQPQKVVCLSLWMFVSHVAVALTVAVLTFRTKKCATPQQFSHTSEFQYMNNLRSTN